MQTNIQDKQEVTLVIGGAGYIGSHTVLYLNQNNIKTIILDNFSQKQNFKPRFNSNNLETITGDYGNTKILENIFNKYNINSILHFAGATEVGLSVIDPIRFYENNISNSIKLIKTALNYNIKKIIFSSTCAVYGIPEDIPITETHSKKPISPYGKTKLMIENLLQDCASAYNLKYIILRYFNAAGAMPEYNLYEQHNPETHLIPLLFNAVYQDKIFNLYGNNYNTKDGTCVRDYLHVYDLASAHYLALEHLNNHNNSNIFNLGTGHGYSVQEIINSLEKILNTKIKIYIADRRAGDPAVLIADASKAKNILKWAPKYSNLEYLLNSVKASYKLFNFDSNKNKYYQKY